MKGILPRGMPGVFLFLFQSDWLILGLRAPPPAREGRGGGSQAQNQPVNFRTLPTPNVRGIFRRDFTGLLGAGWQRGKGAFRWEG